MLCQLLGSGGSGRSAVGIRLSSGALSPITNLSTGTLYFGSGKKREELVHIRPLGIFMTLVRYTTSPLVVGVPSWYRVKSMMTSRRFAGHNSNESRLSGNGSSPPSDAIWVNCMHCCPSAMRYWPSSSSST